MGSGTVGSQTLTFVSTNAPAAASNAENSDMAGRASKQAAFGYEMGDALETTPGVLSSSSFGASSSGGVSNFLAAATAPSIASTPSLDQAPRIIGGGHTQIAVTWPGLGKGWSISNTVRLDAATAFNLQNLFGTINQLQGLATGARTIIGQMSQVAPQLSTIENSLSPIISGLQKALATGDIKTLAALLPAAQQAAAQSLAALQHAQSLVVSAENFTRQGSQESVQVDAGASTRGSLEADVTLRKELGHIRGRNGGVRLTAALSAGMIAPIPAPEQLPIGGLAATHSLMLGVDFLLVGTSKGASALSTTLGKVSDLIGEASRFLGNAKDNPNQFLNTASVNAAKAEADSLSSRASALSAQLTQDLNALSATLTSGVRVRQATGLGAEIRDFGVRAQADDGKRLEGDVAVTVRHPLGYIPGTTSDYSIADAETFSLQKLSTKNENVHGYFYPATVGIDTSASFRLSPAVKLTLRGGTESRVDGNGTVGYLGLVTRIARSYFGITEVIPDLAHGSLYAPELGAVLGYKGPVLQIGAAGSVATKFANGLDVSGAQVTSQLGMAFQ
jgi:cell division septum initiation protein DivIVA